jgi:hypothetical protein
MILTRLIVTSSGKGKPTNLRRNSSRAVGPCQYALAALSSVYTTTRDHPGTGAGFFCSEKTVKPAPVPREGLKRHSGLHLERTRRYKVSAAEGRKKVIECDLVRDVHRRESQGHLRMFGAEQIVRPDAEIK